MQCEYKQCDTFILLQDYRVSLNFYRKLLALTTTRTTLPYSMMLFEH